MDSNKELSMIVKHPQYMEVMERIKRSHQSVALRGRKDNLRIVGVSGVGKSTILRHYKSLNTNVHTESLTIVPVIYLQVPTLPTARQLAINLLKAIGCSDLNGTSQKMMDRFMQLAKNCKVELVIVDEVQHFVDNRKRSTYAGIADLLKQRLDELHCSVIFAGAPYSKYLFMSNNQLRSRYKASISFQPFKIRTAKEFNNFRSVIASCVDEFEDLEKRFFISDDVVERIFYATDGIFRNLLDFISGVKYLKESGQAINLETLSIAFIDNIFASATESNNPFSDNFEFRRLTELDEPYWPSPQDGDNHENY